MIHKTTRRLRLLVLVCALVGAMISTAGNRSASFAQGGCPPGYETCSSEFQTIDTSG